MPVAALLLLQAATAPTAPVTAAPTPVGAAPVPVPPEAWSTLPDLHYRRRPDLGPPVADFVRAEVTAGRCAAASTGPNGGVVQLDLAVQVTADGQLKRIVPRAIGCPAVEQYAAGLVQRLARDNLDLPAGKNGWFHTVLTFAWPA